MPLPPSSPSPRPLLTPSLLLQVGLKAGALAPGAQVQFLKVSHRHQSVRLWALSPDACFTTRPCGMPWAPKGSGHRAGGPGRALIAAHCGHSDLHGQGLRRFLEVHSHPASLPVVGGRRRPGWEPQAASTELSASSWVPPWSLAPFLPPPALRLLSPFL